MVTRYYSEVLNKTFDTEAECVEAEKAYEEKHKAELQLKEERATEAKAVEEAYKKAEEARKEADKLLEAFLKKYKAFHSTTTQVPTKSLFDIFFNNWLF